MSKAWSARSGAERRAVEAAFIARHGAELLLDGDVEPPSATEPVPPPVPRRLPFARLYAAIRGAGPLPADISKALRADPGTRDDFALLLERSACQHLLRAASAAGRDGLDRREAGGFVVRIVASRAEGGQVYLLVELPEEALSGAAEAPGREPESGNPAVPRATAAAPGQIVVRTAAGDFLKRALPPPEDCTIRLVLAADDPLARAVTEPANEIFLL